MKQLNKKYESELVRLAKLMELKNVPKVEEIGHIMDSVECSLANGQVYHRKYIY